MPMESKMIEEISENKFNECVKGKAVIDFFAEWCMPCLMMAPILEEVSDRFKNVKFCKVNIEDNQALASKFKVMSIPTIVVFNNGKEVARINGLQQADVLEEKLNSYF